MALIKVKDVKEAIALMMSILEKLDEIMERTRPDQKANCKIVRKTKKHEGVKKWHTEAERVKVTRSDLPRLQSG